MENFEEKIEKEINHYITLAISGVGTDKEDEFYKRAIKGLKKTKIKYWIDIDDNNLKFKLLRNLSIMVGLVEGLEQSKCYALELYKLITEDKDFRNDYRLDYCRGREEYVDTFKDELDREFVISVMEENMNIYNELGLRPSFLTAKVNIKFLMEDYNSVVNILLEIHTDEEMVDLKRQIETELKKANLAYYDKYLKIINATDSLIS